MVLNSMEQFVVIVSHQQLFYGITGGLYFQYIESPDNRNSFYFG